MVGGGFMLLMCLSVGGNAYQRAAKGGGKLKGSHEKLNRRKPKGDGGKGTGGKIRQDNLRPTSRQFRTFYDSLRHFMTISVSLFHRHKTS